ncbi:hypothetical protein GYH30_041357 [Glycine max]|nr:hypothetical protein GYH30_041357 [Glycine max]
MVGLNVSQPFLSPICKTAPYPLDLIATAACLHFGHLLRRRATHHPRLGVLLHSCFKIEGLVVSEMPSTQWVELSSTINWRFGFLMFN